MRPKRSVADWRNVVFRSTAITDSVRVVLLLLAEYMREDLTVSVPRRTLSTRLGKSERRVSQRIADAHEAGFLDTVVRGQKYTTAVYAATFPNPLSVTVSSTLRVSENDTLRTDISPVSVTPGGPTITTADLPVIGSGGDGGSDDDRADIVDASNPAASGWSA